MSLLPAIGKVFKEIQSAQLLKDLVKNKSISGHQYGFLPKRYTTAQLVFIVENFMKSNEEGDIVSAVFMDFAMVAAAGVGRSRTDRLRSYRDQRTLPV